MKKILPIFCFLLLLATSIVYADSTSFTAPIDIPNSDLYGYPKDYGKVTVELSGNVATISIDGLSHDGYTYLFTEVGLSVNNKSSVTTVNYPSGWSQKKPGNISDFGIYNYIFTPQKQGSAGAVSHIDLFLTGTWSDASNVLFYNDANSMAALHVIVSGANKTGFAGDSPPTVPEPATVLLLGIGLVGVGAISRRRRA